MSTTRAATCAAISAITANGRTGSPKNDGSSGRDLAAAQRVVLRDRVIMCLQ